MIIVSGWLKVDPAARAGYLDECRTVMEQARAAAGCHDFTLSADLLEPGRVNIYERWETDEELALFRGSGPDSAQTAQILDASVAKYRISATEPP
ncbi:putative quinol monooxygenase [Actinokineospora sp.]|uniref:putative quinol monooxygenase n=1 Tax=Actinokineospora sp. TaxID=1872133 RepID=UPI004037F03F